MVVPRNDSVIGWETIRTYHLGRTSLRDAREPIAKAACLRIKCVLRELERTPHDEPRLRRVIGELLALGRASKPHAGMVRILWAQRDRDGLSRQELRALRVKLRRAEKRRS
jgi:hypothetical protein